MLEQIHFLLTYTCNYECDHCFLYCGPNTEGTFTLDQVQKVLNDAQNIKTVEWIYFEGGEPFLYYPLMLKGLQLAKELGFKTGIVTNSYWATSVEDAKLWLKPIIDSGIDNISLSDDSFHNDDTGENSAKIASYAASELGFSANSICIDKPSVRVPVDDKGAPVIGGGALFKGRAVEKLTSGLPTKSVENFVECKHEELVAPTRVHIDSLGNVQVCQGVSIGNMWHKPLSQIINEYDVKNHPVCRLLSSGGPYKLAQFYNVNLDGKFIDECHFCYTVRSNLINKIPEFLTPLQVYGLSNSVN
ncbi:MAG: radical SAM protein [Candidatus Neomarinimicrobiota bacterium]